MVYIGALGNTFNLKLEAFSSRKTQQLRAEQEGGRAT